VFRRCNEVLDKDVSECLPVVCAYAHTLGLLPVWGGCDERLLKNIALFCRI